MSKAISIKVHRAEGEIDYSTSRFFGSPAVPGEWAENQIFGDDELFFAQIRLSDIEPLDRENRLPHTGYLYFFLDFSDSKYRPRAIVRYFGGEPDTVIDNFNCGIYEDECLGDTVTDLLMEFCEAEENSQCTRLFGTPWDWPYAEPPARLLLQYDPLDSDVEAGFLNDIDGMLYFFFSAHGDERDFGAVTAHLEHS